MLFAFNICSEVYLNDNHPRSARKKTIHPKVHTWTVMIHTSSYSFGTSQNSVSELRSAELKAECRFDELRELLAINLHKYDKAVSNYALLSFRMIFFQKILFFWLSYIFIIHAAHVIQLNKMKCNNSRPNGRFELSSAELDKTCKKAKIGK